MSKAAVSEKSQVPKNVGLAAETFSEYGDFIRSVIRYYVNNEAEAEDLFQEVFLFVVSKPIPSNVRNIKGFLYKLVYDIIRDAFRRIDRYQARLRRYSEHRAHAVKDRPEDVLMEMEELTRMFDLIERRLAPKEALAVTLRYRDSCDIREVAHRIGVKPRSVSKYVSVGLKKFRAFLDDEQGVSHDSC